MPENHIIGKTMKTLTIEERLEEYRLVKADLAELKQYEMDLRVEICEDIGKGLEAGTHNFTEYGGLKVKLVSKLSYSIDKGVLETLDLTTEEAECIRWKPEIALKAYRIADTDVLDKAITIKTGAPTLTVELAE
jgi:hypothetical protein